MVPQCTMYSAEFIGPQSFASEFHWRLLMNHGLDKKNTFFLGRLVSPALWMLQCMSHANCFPLQDPLSTSPVNEGAPWQKQL